MLAAFPLTTARTDASGATGTPWGCQTHQQVSSQELHIMRMPRKCVAMPTIDIVQPIVNQRQRKREIAAPLVFACTGH